MAHERKRRDRAFGGQGCPPVRKQLLSKNNSLDMTGKSFLIVCETLAGVETLAGLDAAGANKSHHDRGV